MNDIDEVLAAGRCMACGNEIEEGTGRAVRLGQRVGFLCSDCASRPDRGAKRARRRARRHARLALTLQDLAERLDETINSEEARHATG